MKNIFILLILVIISSTSVFGQSGDWYTQFYSGSRALMDESRIFQLTVDSLYSKEYVFTLISSNLLQGEEPDKIIGCAIGDFENNPKAYIIKTDKNGEFIIKEIMVKSQTLNYVREDFMDIKAEYMHTIPTGAFLFDHPEDPILKRVMDYTMIFRNKETNDWFYWVRIGGFDLAPKHTPPTQKLFLLTYGIITQSAE